MLDLNSYELKKMFWLNRNKRRASDGAVLKQSEVSLIKGHDGSLLKGNDGSKRLVSKTPCSVQYVNYGFSFLFSFLMYLFASIFVSC